jgi:hypothetical protein
MNTSESSAGTIGCLAVFIAAVVIGIAWQLLGDLSAHLQREHQFAAIPTEKARPYKILKINACEPLISNEPIRCGLYIYSDAQSLTERAQTALKASLDAIKSKKADLAISWLVPIDSIALTDGGNNIATATVSGSDTSRLRNGGWQADSSNTKLTQTQLSILKLFYEKSDRFQKLRLHCADNETNNILRSKLSEWVNKPSSTISAWERNGAELTLRDREIVTRAILLNNQIIIGMRCNLGWVDDDQATEQFIAQALNIPVQNVVLPRWTLQPYKP